MESDLWMTATDTFRLKLEIQPRKDCFYLPYLPFVSSENLSACVIGGSLRDRDFGFFGAWRWTVGVRVSG
jgi:hypothetical protein